MRRIQFGPDPSDKGGREPGFPNRARNRNRNRNRNRDALEVDYDYDYDYEHDWEIPPSPDRQEAGQPGGNLSRAGVTARWPRGEGEARRRMRCAKHPQTETFISCSKCDT